MRRKREIEGVAGVYVCGHVCVRGPLQRTRRTQVKGWAFEGWAFEPLETEP
jgi:hypothetical protein